MVKTPNMSFGLFLFIGGTIETSHAISNMPFIAWLSLLYHYFYTKFQLTRGQAGGLYNFVCKEPLTNGATATSTNVSSS